MASQASDVSLLLVAALVLWSAFLVHHECAVAAASDRPTASDHTQSALFQAPGLLEVDIVPRLFESPVHSNPQSEVVLESSPAARHSKKKKASRHQRLFIQSPVQSSPEDSSNIQLESPIQNSPALQQNQRPSPLSEWGNAPVDSAPSFAVRTLVHGVSPSEVLESPIQSTPQLELNNVPAHSSQTELGGSPVGEEAKSAPVSSTPSNSRYTLAWLQTSPQSGRSNSPVHRSPVSELSINAPVKSAPQADVSSSPVQLTPALNELRGVPVHSAPQTERSSSPRHSSPQSDLGSVQELSSPSVKSGASPLDCTLAPTFESPLQSTNVPASEKNAPLYSSPVHLTSNLAVEFSAEESTPIRSTPLGNSSPLDSAPALELEIESSPVESTPMPSESYSSPVDSPRVHSTPQLKNSPLDSTPTIKDSESTPQSDSSPVKSTPQLNNSPLDSTPALEVRSSLVGSTPVRSIPQLNSPVYPSPGSFLRDSRQHEISAVHRITVDSPSRFTM
ncbi:hypothetical protein Mapa_005869 [Marchantia paleacea]|nr:hypothetical protein Mapa_005869 [Marchantia paleacea]